MRLLEEAKLFLNILFQSTHSLRSATTLQSLLFCRINVSIHALLAECDKRRAKRRRSRSCFNPRTPCGVRPCQPSALPAWLVFQSTHSLRSATRVLGKVGDTIACFNPRTPCGVRLNTHTSEGGATSFQSTHSLRSATPHTARCMGEILVSIHALLAECDYKLFRHGCRWKGFNPRTPCGVRLSRTLKEMCMFLFQSTHSLRSATTMDVYAHERGKVSIHALLAECDMIFSKRDLATYGFNPRTPCGVRLPKMGTKKST